MSTLAAARLVPPCIAPPARPLGGLRFVASFVRNPLSVVPRAAYEEDFVYSGGARPFAWITAPALIRAVLLDERDKYRKRSQIRLLAPLLGAGVLTSEGEHWKWQRQAVAPLFRRQELARFVPQFVRAAQDEVARWRASPPGTVQPIERCMTRVTFDVISATLLPSADDTVAPEVERSMGEFQGAGAWGVLYAVANAPQWLPQPGRSRGERAALALRRAVAAMLRERRAGGQADDLMHRLMAARDPETGQAMNDEQLIDNLLTFYLAGHETTAKALTWTLYLLARSPEWSERLREEVAGATGGAPVTAENVERLALVEQVLKESMRLYPPVPLMSRQAVADTRLGPLGIRAGTSVVLPIYAAHRHRRRWRDPDAFDPTRFTPENEAAIERFQYLPFGAGPRICIGMAFAMLEATAMLATFAQHCRFETVPGGEPEPIARVTLVPRGGMPLKVWTGVGGERMLGQPH